MPRKSKEERRIAAAIVLLVLVVSIIGLVIISQTVKNEGGAYYPLCQSDYDCGRGEFCDQGVCRFIEAYKISRQPSGYFAIPPAAKYGGAIRSVSPQQAFPGRART